jgi:hypothetical protein
MRFHLHLVTKGAVVEDPDGTDLPDLDAAMQEAEGALREIVAAAIKSGDDDTVPDAIIVADGSGQEIRRLSASSVIPQKLK